MDNFMRRRRRVRLGASALRKLSKQSICT
jgi:hypothetical protein